METYIQLGLAVALVLGAIWAMMPKKKDNLILTMEDEGTGGAAKAVSKRARAKVRAPGSQPAAQGAASAQDQRRDTVDSILKKADQKRDGASRELYNELDKNGPWRTDEYGILEPELFVKLRQIITVCQFKRFVARKQELLDERIAAHKAG